MSRSLEYERQRSFRAILQKPLLTSNGLEGEEYRLVRTHAQWLKEWFARNAEWSFHVDTEVARLRKTPSDLRDSTRGAVSSKGVGFSKRRYVILCLALSALEQAERQVVLGQLAESIIEYIASDPTFADAGCEFDLKSIDQRRDLVETIRSLIEFGVLQRIDGDEQQFLNQSGDVLYNINRPVLAAMLNIRRSPSTISASNIEDRLRAITEEFSPETDDGHNRRIRSLLVRRLLDDPVLYTSDLSDEERAYLTSQRAFLTKEIASASGLVPEIRKEGIAMTDVAADLTDLCLPEEGTDGHVALLLAEWLAAHAKVSPETAVSYASIHQHVAKLIQEHRSHWRKEVREPGAETILAEQTIERLVALRLARTSVDGVIPLPAIARFALGEISQQDGTQ